MTDLERLASFSGDSYKTVQYSSYDRRSKSPSDSGWFANEDGFGNEPIPGFEKVLKEPDSTGIGEYLICDIKGQGVIQRLWSAGITGKIRLFLDDDSAPFYEGDAQPLFHNMLHALSSGKITDDYQGIIRQFDASYFPVPFSKNCRMEWTGNIKELHFYHVGVRLYDRNTKMESFRDADLSAIKKTISEVAGIMVNPDGKLSPEDGSIKKESPILPDHKAEILEAEGERAIERFIIKINAADTENALRKCILSVFFDNSSVPQIHAPLGDFFGSAPGINPFESLPFSVKSDGTMICRFIMPFRSAVRVIVENNSGETVNVSSAFSIKDFKWEDGKTMHFRCRWKNDNGITASNINIPDNSVSDIIYLMVMGKGRIIGASALIHNPSHAPVSWGNWWGEGDEKIFVDSDTFPSFFGTGSEDYFNYSWSSARILNYPYCGQPRNDGPGNRGYVSNYRWHVWDDIPFNEKIAFYMELGHHGTVPGFAYGRTVYYYALPGTIDDFKAVSKDEIADITYDDWSPEAYLGSAGFSFIEAEKLVHEGKGIRLVNESFCSGKKMLEWIPGTGGRNITLTLKLSAAKEDTNLGFTLLHTPEGGKISVSVNNKPVKIGSSYVLDLGTSGYKALDNHFTEKINLQAGVNKITIRSEDSSALKKAGIDFLWIRN